MFLTDKTILRRTKAFAPITPSPQIGKITQILMKQRNNSVPHSPAEQECEVMSIISMNNEEKIDTDDAIVDDPGEEDAKVVNFVVLEDVEIMSADDDENNEAAMAEEAIIEETIAEDLHFDSDGQEQHESPAPLLLQDFVSKYNSDFLTIKNMLSTIIQAQQKLDEKVDFVSSRISTLENKIDQFLPS